MSFVVLNHAAMLKFEDNTEGRARLWDTALKFLSPVPRVTSPDHLAAVIKTDFSVLLYVERR